MPDIQAGINIVLRALETPIRQIVENAGVEGSIVVAKVLESKSDSFGFDAQNEKYTDLVSAGIIDPTKVVRTALQDAASVAGLAGHHRSHGRRDSEEGRSGSGHASRRRHGWYGLLVQPQPRQAKRPSLGAAFFFGGCSAARTINTGHSTGHAPATHRIVMWQVWPKVLYSPRYRLVCGSETHGHRQIGGFAGWPGDGRRHLHLG